MKITDLIVESEQQIDELSGAGVGKAASAVGAVAGGVQGAWDAAKQGFQSGRKTVAGGANKSPAAAPTTTATTAAPTTTGAPAAGEDPAALQQEADRLEAELKVVKGKIATASKAAAAAPKQSLADKVSAAQAPAAEPAATPPAADPAATTTPPPATPAADPAATPAPATTTPPAGSNKLTKAQQDAMKAKLQGKRAAGKTAGTAPSGFNQYTKDASSQRIVGANPDGSPKIQTIKASKINLGNNLSETLAQKIEQHKRKIFESGLSTGTSSVFKK